MINFISFGCCVPVCIVEKYKKSPLGKPKHLFRTTQAREFQSMEHVCATMGF